MCSDLTTMWKNNTFHCADTGTNRNVLQTLNLLQSKSNLLANEFVRQFDRSDQTIPVNLEVF